MYLSGTDGALQPLAEECMAIAQQITWGNVRKLRLCVGHDRVEQIAHDASAALMESYLRDGAFRVSRFATYLSYRVKDQLFISPRQKQKMFEARVIFEENVKPCDHEERASHNGDALLEIAESHSWGKKAVADLCRSRSYRQAIKRIAAYVERRWIYDHAEALHQVYRALHAKKGENGGVSRSGLVGVRKALLRRRETEHEQTRE